jgi:ribosomal protein L37AE/L43A
MTTKGRNALEGCPVCGRDLEYKRDTHESSLGYREPVDEIWECSKCQAEFKIARKPIILEEINKKVDTEPLIMEDFEKDLTLILNTDDLEVWLYDKVFESNCKKYQLAEVFRFEDNNYNNCRIEIHLLPVNPSDYHLKKAKQIVGLENDLKNEEIRKDKENLFCLLIDTNYSYVYFKESDYDMQGSVALREAQTSARFKSVIEKVEYNKSLENFFPDEFQDRLEY